MADLFWIGLVVWLIVVAGSSVVPQSPGLFDAAPPPTPTPDPLATPVLPENPTQVDVGRNLYYYDCMPCHGDHGQGLTDEWRQTWVEDHQDCWARGCHGGRLEDEGLPLPTFIPPVGGSPLALARFSEPGDLYDYLSHTHPPQNPGALADDAYWALTAYLLTENGRLLPGSEIGPHAAAQTHLEPKVVAAISGGLLVTAVFLLWWARKREMK